MTKSKWMQEKEQAFEELKKDGSQSSGVSHLIGGFMTVLLGDKILKEQRKRIKKMTNKQSRYSNMNLAPKRNWTKEEDEFILQAYDDLSDRELATELKRTLESTRSRRKRLKGIKSISKGKLIWSFWVSKWRISCIKFV